MIIENVEALKSWLTSYLEPMCEADPAALAKYVMALIKKDKTEKDLKTICLDQLEVFLQKETISFVDTLFESIANKSYLKPPATSQNVERQPRAEEVTVQNANSSKANSTDNQSSNVAEHPCISQSLAKTDQTNHDTHCKARDRRNRSRSRSRSRSPIRQNRLRDLESRRVTAPLNRNNAGQYYPDERRNRRGNLTGRTNDTRRFSGGYGRDRDYQRRQNDRKRGRSRSRSRSYSSSTSSRSRSPRSRNTRSRSRSRSREHSPFNKRSRPTSKSPSPNKNLKEGDKHKRCRDYDEQGYCMKGDYCPYDHGNDPVVLDGAVSAALGLTNPSQSGNPPQPGLLPLPSQNVSSTSNSYLAEPYNPEAPGIDSHVMRRVPPMGMPRMPHPNPYWVQTMGGLRPPLPPGVPPPFMQPPGRPRELIGVPTIDNGVQGQMNRNMGDGNMMHSVRGHHYHRGMNRGHRGGYRGVRKNDSADKTVLEVRKIPSHLNTIPRLNEHFSKFGNLVNVQIKYDDDPEAALVQFATRAEALAAIRSTEAVLNNRFIKVFWHSKEQQNYEANNQTLNENSQAVHSNEAENDHSVNPHSKMSIKERLGPKVEETNETVTTTAVNASGTISRTVFDPSKLKKTNPSATQSQGLAKKGKIKLQQLQQKTEYRQKLQKMLESNLSLQKKLTEKLSQTKDEQEKQRIKNMLNKCMESCNSYQSQIKEVQESISSLVQKKKQQKTPQTKEELYEELLNADLDIHVKGQNRDPTFVDDLEKLVSLKKKARALGVAAGFNSSLRGVPRTSSYRGRAMRGRGFHSSRNPLLKVDRRTRKVLIPGVHEDDATDLLGHLAQFSDVECIEPSNSGAIVTFKTRQDAENAVQHIGSIKIKKDSPLTYNWFDEPKNSKSNVSKSTIAGEIDDKEVGLIDDVEDEEDEDEDESEARNWKR